MTTWLKVHSWNDERMESVISTLLRTGVTLSATVVFLGGVCFLAQHGNDPADYHVFHGAQASFRSASGIVRAARPSDCLGIIQFGLLLLILTPMARVAFSLAGFVLEHDRVYAGLTAAVLAILVYGLFGHR
jgi:uncharacterized membrane protein